MRSLSIVSVLVLTVSNVLLTIRLLHIQSCSYAAESVAEAVPVIPKAPQITAPHCTEYALSPITGSYDRPAFYDIDFGLGRWDSRRMYKYYDFAIVGERFADLSEQYSVCLATQSSIERLFSLVEVAEHWNGPISAAVYAAGDDEFYILQLYLTYLKRCFDSIREKVSFHLSFPKQRHPKENRRLQSRLLNYDCAKPEATLKELLKIRTSETSKWRLKNVYPQNHLRNLARKGCQNENVFLTDVDIVPSINFTEHLDKFLRATAFCSKCAYVIPTYEIDVRVRFPSDKNDLVRLVKKGLARPFHQKVFIYNQFATNFSKWQADLRDTNETYVSHNVTNFEFLYEPFYVANDAVPPHDERFMGYGFTRNSQVYEMYVAGYQFQVLSPIFSCHWGLQQKKTRPGWREQQNNANRKQFEIFNKEVLARYRKDPLKLFAGGVGVTGGKNGKSNNNERNGKAKN